MFHLAEIALQQMMRRQPISSLSPASFDIFSDIYLSTRLLSNFIKLHEDFFSGGFAPVFAYGHQPGYWLASFCDGYAAAILHFLQKA
jgi:hypothetical protein